MKPTIRIIHNLARSGGTIISRCLGCMDGVALLSEIHPTICHEFNDPVRQARDWYGIRNTRSTEFVDIIKEIAYWASEQGRALVLRSWDHVDFVPSRFNHTPAMRSTLTDALRGHFDLLEAWLLRGAGPQWASLRAFLKDDQDLEQVGFWRGHEAFVGQAGFIVTNASVFYEDFCASPRTVLALLCRQLNLRYDPQWETRWPDYVNVTGDIASLDRKEIGGEPCT